MGIQAEGRTLSVGGGKFLRATPVFDTYWRFAAARQDLFARRIAGSPPPWTSDQIIAAHRFTNPYRAADRVSQYLIRNVIYSGGAAPEEVFFRTILFKLFNRVDTWEALVEGLGSTPSWKGFAVERYASILDAAYARGERLYSAAYIMPSPPFGSPRKHRNHLQLLDRMMRDGAPQKVARASSLRAVFETLRGYPSFGDFLAFQYAIDLNYSEIVDFSEMDFVVAGPGAKNGLAKCFSDMGGLSEADVIRHVAQIADEEFDRLGLRFKKLGGVRPLQLIDCQNLFCEVDKYARVAHPEFAGVSGRTRIKQKFVANSDPLPQFYPPKWHLTVPAPAERAQPSQRRPRARQTALSFA